jgi:RNA polymerase sigma factor (sigma-70 family)
VAQPENAAAQAAVLPRDPGPPTAPTAPPEYLELYRTAFRPLVVYLIVYGATPAEAEDAAEDALVDLLRRWPITGSPLAYAKVAARNYFLKARARDRRQAGPPASAPRPQNADDGQLAAIDSRDWATNVLSHLTPAEREVMELAADGLDYHDIAELARITQVAARQRAFTARRKLKALLNPDGSYRQPHTEPSQVHTRKKEAR